MIKRTFKWERGCGNGQPLGDRRGVSKGALTDSVHTYLSLLPHLIPTMVLLVTSDNEQFVVDKDVAERSVLIKNMLEGSPLPSFFIYMLPTILTRDFQMWARATNRYRCRTSHPAF